MQTFPMPTIPVTGSGNPTPKPANNDRWGKFGIKNPSAPQKNDDDGDKDGDDKSESYAKGGFIKGEGARTASYAAGGPVLGRTREFLKEPSPFRSGVDGVAPANQRPIAAGGAPGEPTSAYAKSGKGEKGRDKSLPTVMPRK